MSLLPFEFIENYKNEKLIEYINKVKISKNEETMGALLLFLINTTTILPYRKKHNGFFGYTLNLDKEIYLPIFSEISELKKYSEFIGKEKEKQGIAEKDEATVSITAVIECLKMVAENPYLHGIVLDPFGVNLILTKELILNLIENINLESVAIKNSNSTEVFLDTITQKEKFETTIKSIKEFAKTDKHIKKIYMLYGETASEVNKSKSIYFIIDTELKTKKEREKMYSALSKVIAKSIKMNFVLTSVNDNKDIKNIYNEENIIYEK